jgi:uncharacterized protein (DUF2147 family)
MALAGLAGLLCLAFAVSSARAGDAAASTSSSPIGVWATEGASSHIKIADCGGKLCGSLTWLKEPLNKEGKEKVDSENPDPSLQSRKLLGLPLLDGFVADGDGTVWGGGTIYNPDDGKTYSCKLTMLDAKTMKVRGYIGISLFGKTQVWNRVE